MTSRAPWRAQFHDGRHSDTSCGELRAPRWFRSSGPEPPGPPQSQQKLCPPGQCSCGKVCCPQGWSCCNSATGLCCGPGQTCDGKKVKNQYITIHLPEHRHIKASGVIPSRV